MRLVSFIVISTIAAATAVTKTVTSSKSVPVVQHRQLRSTLVQQQLNQEVQETDNDSNTNRKLNIVDGLGGIINDILGNDNNNSTDSTNTTDSSSNNDKNNTTTLTDKVTNVANDALYNLTGYNSSVITQLINIFDGNETTKLVPDGTIDDIILTIIKNTTLVDELLQSNGNIDSNLLSTIIENSLGLNLIGVNINLTSILGNDTLFNTSSIFNTIVNETNTTNTFDTILEYLQDNTNNNTAATIVPSAYFQNIITDTFFNRTNNNNNETTNSDDNDDNDINNDNDKDRNFTLSDIINFNWNNTGIIMDLVSINNVTDLWNELRDNDNNNSTNTTISKNESAAILQPIPTMAPVSSSVSIPTTATKTNTTTNSTKTNTTGTSTTTTTSNANMEQIFLQSSSITFLLGTLLMVAAIL